MHSIFTILLDILFVCFLLLQGYRLYALLAMRSINGKSAIRYPLYEEQNDKVVFHPRRYFIPPRYKAYILLAIPFLLLGTRISVYFLLSMPIVIFIVYAALWFYHSFERVEIDKQGAIHKYDFNHRDLPIIMDNTNGIINKVIYPTLKIGEHRVSYFLCCNEERILLFHLEWGLFESDLDRKAEKLLTTILPKYGISNPCFINEHADSVI